MNNGHRQGVACTLFLVHGLIVAVMGLMIYIHAAQPVTAYYMKKNGFSVIKSTDAFAENYGDDCRRILAVSYIGSALGFIQFLVLLIWRRVECVFQFLVLAVLAFYQVADFLQCIWMEESYGVITYGV